MIIIFFKRLRFLYSIRMVFCSQHAQIKIQKCYAVLDGIIDFNSCFDSHERQNINACRDIVSYGFGPHVGQ